MEHLASIQASLEKRTSHSDIVRKIFLSYPTKVFVGDEERQYLIFNEVSDFFGVSIIAVQVAGSAKTGRSFHKNRDFKPGESDLDLAIIDPDIFRKYMEMVFRVTRGYSDRTGFPVRDGKSSVDEYFSYLQRGIFRADLMPSCNGRAEWNQFFGRLSARHGDVFKSINAVVYMSQAFFEAKQRSVIRSFLDNRAI